MGGKKNDASAGFLDKLSSCTASKQASLMIAASAVSVVLSVIIAVNFITPFLVSLALAPFLLGAMKQSKHRDALRLTFRWVITVFIFVAIASVYLPHRMQASIPFAPSSVAAFTGWISGAVMKAPFGLWYILIGILGICAASLATGGLAAVFIGSTGICTAAYVLAYITRHGDNIIHLGLIGLPPWIISFALSAVFILIPSASPLYKRLAGTGNKEKTEKELLLRYTLLGTAFLILSVILYITLSGPWRTMLNGCTLL